VIEGEDFVVFADDWGRHPSSCQHIFKRIAPENRVLWVNTIGMRLPKLSLNDVRRIGEKLAEWSRPPERGAREPVEVFSPAMLPFSGSRLCRHLNRQIVVKGIRKRMESLGMSSPILVATVPNAADFVGHLGEKAAVYYCVDDFTEWPGVSAEPMRTMEAELLAKADLVVATSAELSRTRRRPGDTTYLLPHGVDVEHFRAVWDQKCRVADAFDKLPKPVIGYFGLFDERSDFELLARIATLRPTWSFAIVGKAEAGTMELGKFPNFHFLGPVPYGELPSYAAGFDVCMLAYRINKLTENINPVKLREYLATGRPVVSTRLPEVVQFDGLVHLAATADGFAEKIELALAEAPQAAAARVAAVQSESWEARAETFCEYLSGVRSVQRRAA